MLVGDIKEGNKKILMIGLNSIGISLSKILSKYGNILTFLDYGKQQIKTYKEVPNINLEIINLTECDFNNYDYIIINKKLDQEDTKNNNLLNILMEFFDKTYILPEIINVILPDKNFIYINDDTYKYLVYSELNKIYKENSINSITVPYFENEELEEPTIIELSEIDNFMICNYNKEFVKNIDFNIICFLDSQEYEIEEIKNTIIKQNQNTKILINLDNNYLKELYKIIQKDNISKNIIPISNDKMMEKGYSYINNTIYCNDKNESYDIIENDCIVNNIVKISVLVSFIIAYNTSQTVNDVVECLNNFQGIPNIIEYTNKINNIKFINNIWAPTLKILTAPLETYDNIYVIFVTNYKQNNFLNIKNYKDKIRKIFLIDIFNCIILNEFSNKIEIEKCNNINDAFEKAIKSINESINNTEINEATILLSPVIADKNNFIYYKDNGIKFKKLIEDL